MRIKIIDGVTKEDLERNVNKWLSENERHIDKVKTQYVKPEKDIHTMIITCDDLRKEFNEYKI